MLIKRFFGFLTSYIIAILRLLLWEVILFFSGLQQIFFSKSEVCGVEVKVIPLWCEREDMFNKMSYIDKLATENPDLAVIDEEDVNNFIDDVLDEDDDENEDK